MRPSSLRLTGMRKYYVAFALLSAVVLAIAIAILSTELPLRHDRVTGAHLEIAAQNVRDYYSAHDNTLPTNLGAAYIKGTPKDVSYEHLNKDAYMLCATFTRKSSSGYVGDDSDKTLVAIKNKRERADSSTHYVVVGTYYSYITSEHEVGKNCYINTMNYNYDTPASKWDIQSGTSGEQVE